MCNRFYGKRFLIAGKGISGKGAHEALVSYGAVCDYFEDVSSPCAFAPDGIIVSPGIDRAQPCFTFARSHSVPIFGELELGFMLCSSPVIAVTGTNGKTTVTKLIGEILRKAGYKTAVCGNVGESFALAASTGGFDYAVVESSSFQLETVQTFAPHVAVITNISEDHLNRHGTMRAYIDAKLNIAARQTADDFLILSADDITVGALGNFTTRAQVMYTSVREKTDGAYVQGERIYWQSEEICEVSRVKIYGEHNLKNALSAVCAAKALGVQNGAIVSSLTEFKADGHRLNLVAHKCGKNFYDDSKGTNIMASVSAAQCMSGPTCMIVGGSDKGYEYDELFRLLPECVVKMAAVGETATKIAEAAARNGFAAIEKFTDFAQAFEWAAAGEEENVLLSPASASFDMFSSYAERGDYFVRLVQNVCKE